MPGNGIVMLISELTDEFITECIVRSRGPDRNIGHCKKRAVPSVCS